MSEFAAVLEFAAVSGEVSFRASLFCFRAAAAVSEFPVYRAIGVSTAMSRSLRSRGRMLWPFMRIWTSCPSASIASTCSKNRRFESCITGGDLRIRRRKSCGSVGPAFEVVDRDLRHDGRDGCAYGVFQRFVVGERRRARGQQRADGLDRPQAANPVVWSL